MRRRFVVLLVSLGVAAAGFAFPTVGTSQTDIEPAPGSILAPIARQAGWLSLLAPRPRLLTAFVSPMFVSDLAASNSGRVVVAVQSFDSAREVVGGDLLGLDVDSGETTPFILRQEARESLGAPFWHPDGSLLFYQREDQTLPPKSYAGQAVLRFPSRVESAQADGSNRVVLQEGAWQPAVSPNGARLAYVRSSAAGVALLVRNVSVDFADEREVVPIGRFPDISYPRFSPDGEYVVFAALETLTAGDGLPDRFFFGPAVAFAHGLPWDVWLVRTDGTGLQMLAALGADDPSISWSPDGRQLFIYGGAGSYFVDVASGNFTSYPFLAGYGATAWVP